MQRSVALIQWQGINIPEKWQLQRGNRCYLTHRCFFTTEFTKEFHKGHKPIRFLCFGNKLSGRILTSHSSPFTTHNLPRLLRYICLPLLLLLTTGQQRDSATGLRLLREAESYFDSARYEEALSQAHLAMGNIKADTPDMGECLLLLGHVFLEKGDFEAARQQYRLALGIFQSKLGSKHALTAQAINSLGEYYYKKNDVAESEKWYEKALNIRLVLFGHNHESVADSYNNLGNCSVQKGRYMEALARHQKALDIRQTVLPADHPDLATSNNNLGNCYLLLGKYPEALRCFETALRIRQQVLGADHPKTAQVLNNLGNCYATLGRRGLAARYYRQAVDIRRRHFGADHPGVAAALENIGELHFDNGDYIAALDAFREAYGIQQTLHPAQSAPVASLQQKMGLCYQYGGDFDRALALQLDAEKALSAALGAEHPSMAGLLNNIGNCYVGKKDYAQAIAYYRKAEKVYQVSGQGKNPDVALLYNNLGVSCLEQNNAPAALAYFEKAEQIFRNSARTHPDFSISLKNKGLALERTGKEQAAQAAFEQALREDPGTDPVNKVEVLTDYGAVLCRRGIRNHDTVLLRQSLTVLETALQFADSLRLQLTASAARQRWLDKQYPAHISAVEACFHLWQLTGESPLLERAFILAERSRSLQLLENLHKEKAARFAGVPDSLLEKERYWGEELNIREKNRLSWLSSGELEKARAAEAGITEARQVVNALVSDIEKQYPDYYRLKYAVQTATLQTVRTTLLKDDKQALVEYFMADSVLFVFVITQDVFQGIRLVKNFPLDSWMSDFRNSVQAYPGASGTAATTLSATYADRAFRIFQNVVAPVQAAVALPEKLIIIPDGALSYLPFEALLCEQPADVQKFKQHHYLLRDYQISYGYSATQLVDLQSAPAIQSPKTLLGIAPDFKDNPYGLRPLQHNRTEAREVCKLLGGDLLDREQATVAAFLKKAGDYRILLLSTHGQASSAAGDFSYLAFAPSLDTQSSSTFLYVRDLYLQRLPAELVVLSACETSVGENRLGEGVISLAKGFFHAGARSIVATLWSVDDAKNAKLIRLFFQNIRSGMSKDAALRQAKLRFLEELPHDEAHPVFWAAAVANGDMAAMAFPGSMVWWMVAGVVLVLAACFFWKKIPSW